MQIRPATAADVPQVLPMVEKICAFHESIDPAKYSFHSDPAEMYRGWLIRRAEDRSSVFLVADANAALDAPAQVVGFLIATIEPELSIYRLDEFGFIHDVWVEDNYRNEGLARQMVTLAVERFREMGVTQVRCDTLVTNDSARGLFERCGFRASIVEMLIELGNG